MDITELKKVLLFSTVINYGVLLTWFVVFVCAHDWLYQMHTRWFKLLPETFDALNYVGVAMYKIGIMLLNLVPLIVLCVAGQPD